MNRAGAWWPVAGAAVVFATMGLEAWLATRNEGVLRTWGAREVPDASYPWMRVSYPAGFVAMAVEGWWRGGGTHRWLVVGLLVFAAGKAIKYAAIAVLGPRWSFRVLTVPGRPLVADGIYRWLRHPNYVGVAAEIVGVALWMPAPITGTLFAVTFGVILLCRIRIEERALGLARSR
ncbi:MAG: isoprenylcysteine carboxylmethyltransferase family protein [Luteitalea sp.]